MSAYVPILTAERSQLAGLAATTDAVKDHLTPLFDVPTPDLTARRPAAPHRAAESEVEGRLAEVVDAVAAAFGSRRAFLDCPADDRHRVPDGRLHGAWLLDEARARGLALVPVTGLRRSAAHHLAAADAASVDRRGVCLRLQLPDFADLDALPERVLALADALGVAPDQVDLLVDLGRVADEESRVLALAARAVLSPLRRAARWRSVVLAAGRTPRPAAAGVDAHVAAEGAPALVGQVPRTEWLLWRALAADAPALGFGDYAGLGGDEGDGRRARPPADDRGERPGPARDAEWLVVRAVRRGDARDPRGDEGDDALPLAALADRADFFGVGPCADDAGLDAVRPPAANGVSKDAPENTRPEEPEVRLAAWRAAVVTHHLTVTVEGIARVESRAAQPAG